MPLDDFTYNIYTRPSIAYVYDYSLFRVFHRVIFWLLCVLILFSKPSISLLIRIFH